MDLFGEFQKAEIDGKPYLVYQNVMKPLPQIHTPSSKLAIDSGDDFLPQPLFLCPRSRTRIWNSCQDMELESGILAKIETPPLFDDTSNGHHVLPLFWCNNKEVDPQGKECGGCAIQTIGTDYYFCVECDQRFHKECVESPLEINHPSHVKHSLQLYFSQFRSDHCIYCREKATFGIYYCAPCDIYMHMLCAKMAIPCFKDQPKRHDHTLTLFPRQASLTCNICGLVNKLYLTYVCTKCDFVAHSDCIHIPQTIRISRHLHHVSFTSSLPLGEWSSCGVCRREIDRDYGAYTCNVCSGYAVHTRCALRKDIWDGIEIEGVPEDGYQPKIPFLIDRPKKHKHTLTLFPRQASLTCNICGLVNKLYLTYVCAICDFVAHSDCIDIPTVIKISRHMHRFYFTFSLPLGKWSCGVCRQEIDSDYGAYTCNKCSGYAVHTRCALRKDIWDGIEFEEVDEDVEPLFERIADGIILHFSHGCHLEFKTYNGVYDEEKFCQACVLPIYEKNFYECVECDFILHKRCADAPREKVHPLHFHPLKQKVANLEVGFNCYACNRVSNSFRYECAKQDCDCILDVVCASVSEPFDYKGHEHPLYLALDPKEKPICHICKSTEIPKVLNCIECNFIICFKCATLPYKVRTGDEHYLTFCRGDEASGSDWCELCEEKLAKGGEEGFYKCNDGCTTLHINCLLGPDPYLKPGLTILVGRGEVLVQRNNSASRPICTECKILCPYPIYLEYRKEIYCTLLCIDANN